MCLAGKKYEIDNCTCINLMLGVMHYWPPCHCCRKCTTLNEIFALISATMLTPVDDFKILTPASCFARALNPFLAPRPHLCSDCAPGRGDFFRPIWEQVFLQIDQLAKSNLRSGQSQVRKAAPCVRTADDAPAVVASSRLWPILVAREREPVACCDGPVEVESSALGCQWWWWWWWWWWW